LHRTTAGKVSDDNPTHLFMRLSAVGIAAPCQIDSSRRDKTLQFLFE